MLHWQPLRYLWAWLVIILAGAAGQPMPVLGQAHIPCAGDEYGGVSVRAAIEHAMLSGSTESVVHAINKGKALRGNAVGCATQGYKYSTSNTEQPPFAEVFQVWQAVHAPALSTFRARCPSVGREWAAAALGAYYARLVGGKTDTTALIQIAQMTEAQQYKRENAGDTLVAPEGIFAYPQFFVLDSCYRQDAISDGVNAICKLYPSLCVNYKNGLYAGQKFVVADVKPSLGLFDGGMSYDHAWSATMMIEASLQLPDWGMQEFCRRSALMAGEWAITEPPVRTHHYTAKLVWLLAQLYDLTVDKRYRKAMVEKLDLNLIPGVVMDEDGDGNVDGMVKRPIAYLDAPVARRAGRMWDGLNSLPGYQAINTWAFVEAYCALRDREGLKGEDSLYIRKIKRYAVAMLDNLAWEVVRLGPPMNTGISQIPFALLLGLWKIAAYERQPNALWEEAMAVLWNTGYAKTFGASTPSVGLYMAYRSGKRYLPLYKREPVVANVKNIPQKIVLEQNTPNPFSDHTTIRFQIATAGLVTLKIHDIVGHEVAAILKNEWMPAGTHYVNCKASDLPSGSYVYRLQVGEAMEYKLMQVVRAK